MVGLHLARIPLEMMPPVCRVQRFFACPPKCLRPNPFNSISKLYTEQHPSEARSSVDAVGCLPDLLYAFQTVTGWSLQYVTGAASKLNEGLTVAIPVNAGRDAPAGHLRLQPAGETRPGDNQSRSPVERSAARLLAASMADMLGELMQTRYALWRREAELAAGVPVVPHREEEKHLAARLEAVLKGERRRSAAWRRRSTCWTKAPRN